MRCAPQVAGGFRDTLSHTAQVAERELAAAVDNPVVAKDGRVVSNGNFHGAPGPGSGRCDARKSRPSPR